MIYSGQQCFPTLHTAHTQPSWSILNFPIAFHQGDEVTLSNSQEFYFFCLLAAFSLTTLVDNLVKNPVFESIPSSLKTGWCLKDQILAKLFKKITNQYFPVPFPLPSLARIKGIRGLFITVHSLRNLWIGLISLIVCPWQAFPAYCNVIL